MQNKSQGIGWFVFILKNKVNAIIQERVTPQEIGVKLMARFSSHKDEE